MRTGEKETEKMRGKVWLVGAGPSGAELLTLKAKKVIEQADVVVYDALVGQSVVDIIPGSTEKINAGKRAGRHSMLQSEINELLRSLAKQGKRTVRLKGGDPFLFGRGGEELEFLREYGIPYEVVPGVTSATAVPAYFGIPVTHRELASSVHIITGHQKKDEPLGINYRALKEAGGTLVFLMSTMSLHNVVIGLMEAGMDPEMPAAVLQQGAGSRQKKIGGTLATLESEAEKQGISTPAIIVIGEVVRLGERLAWFEKLPLFGKRFIVTRPKERIKELADRLRELGAEVVELPTIEVRGIHPNETLRRELARLSDYRFLVFTSPAGVNEFMKELFDMGKDTRYLSGVSLAVIGSGTAKALRQYGLLADLMPGTYNGKALGAHLAEKCQNGDKVLLARSAVGNPEVIEEMQKEKDITVTDVSAYDIMDTVQTSDETEHGERQSRFADPDNVEGIFFTSASTVRGLAAMFPGQDFSKVQALCIGEMTAHEAEKYGMRVEIAEKETIESLIELALRLFADVPGQSDSAADIETERTRLKEKRFQLY